MNLAQRFTNIVTFTLVNTSLTFYISVEDTVSSMMTNIQLLWLAYDTRHLKKFDEIPFRPGFLLSLTRFQHLQSLDWVTCESDVHVGDFLHLQRSCPGLTELTLEILNTAYYEPSSRIDEVTTTSLPLLCAAIPGTDTDGLYCG